MLTWRHNLPPTKKLRFAVRECRSLFRWNPVTSCSTFEWLTINLLEKPAIITSHSLFFLTIFSGAPHPSQSSFATSIPRWVLNVLFITDSKWLMVLWASILHSAHSQASEPSLFCPADLSTYSQEKMRVDLCGTDCRNKNFSISSWRASIDKDVSAVGGTNRHVHALRRAPTAPVVHAKGVASWPITVSFSYEKALFCRRAAGATQRRPNKPRVQCNTVLICSYTEAIWFS